MEEDIKLKPTGTTKSTMNSWHFSISNDEAINPEIPPKPQTLKNKPTLELVMESIKAVGVPKKGASYQAIKKWISAHQEVKISSLKLAILKGIEKGLLVRPSKYKAHPKGVNGFFCLKEENPKLKKKAKTSKMDVNKSPVEDAESKPTKDKKKSSAKVSKKPPKIVTIPTSNSTTKADKTLLEIAARKSLTKAVKKMNSKAAEIPPKKVVKKVPSKTKGSPELKPVEKELLPTTTRKNPGKAKQDSKKIAKGDSKNIEKIDSKKISKPAKIAKDTATKVAKIGAKKTAPSVVKESSTHNKLKGTGSSKLEDNIEQLKDEIKSGRNKRLYSTRDNINRKDLSDTEVHMKKKHFKTIKSHSSDTELELSKMEEAKAKKDKKIRRKSKQ